MKLKAFIILFSIFYINSFHIRESDDNILWVNIPVEVNDIKQFLTPDLQPSIYNEKAWISVMLFNINSIKTNVSGFWVEVPMTTGLTTKISLLVETAKGEMGYLILSMDFDSGFIGTLKALGCSKTEIGVICEVCKSLQLDHSNTTWVSKHGHMLTAAYNVNESKYENSDFAKFIAYRPYKFEKDSNSKTYFYKQAGKDSKRNFEFKSINMTNIQSNILTKRFGILSKYEENLCRDNICFWSNYLVFEDDGAVEYK